MNFDTPNNACLSLRLLAEKIRAGEIRVMDHKVVQSPGNAFFSLDLAEWRGGRG